MTPDILEYLLRATAIWAVLLAYYFVSGRRERFRFQRGLLLGGWLFGLLVPLLPALAVGTNLPVASLPTASYVAPVFVVQAGEAAVENSWTMLDVLPWVYLLGVIVFGARTLVQWRFVQQCLRGGRQSTYAGYPVVRSEKVRSPFAARGYVFLPEQMPDAALEHTALLHETSHLRARHHYDKLLLTLGGIVLWFHPFTWVYRRLLATVHEYEADAAVLQSVPARTYGLQLLHCSLGPTGSLGLFSSPLQKRITMISTNTKSRRSRFLPILFLALLLGGLTFACSDLGQSDAAPAEQTATETVEGPLADDLNATDRSGGFYAETESLETSMNAYLKDIYEEIRYPAQARTTGTTGKFRAALRLGLDGKIETISISEFTNKLAGGPPAFPEIVIVGHPTERTEGAQAPEVLVKEIDRVLMQMDKFQGMLMSGKPRKQSMNIDFTFELKE